MAKKKVNLGKHAKKWYDLGYNHGKGDLKLELAKQKKELVEKLEKIKHKEDCSCEYKIMKFSDGVWRCKFNKAIDQAIGVVKGGDV